MSAYIPRSGRRLAVPAAP